MCFNLRQFTFPKIVLYFYYYCIIATNETCYMYISNHLVQANCNEIFEFLAFWRWKIRLLLVYIGNIFERSDW